MPIEQKASLKKIIAGFAIFGFLLSFITGLISSVLFGALILRALLFAALFGGIGFTVFKLSLRFIPELFSEASDSFDDTEEPPIDGSEEKISGENLDITVEDEPDDGSWSAETVEELEPAEKDSVEDEGVDDAGDVEEVEELEEVSEDDLSGEKDPKKSKEETSEGNLPDIDEFADSFESSESDGDEVSSGLSNIDGAGDKGVEVMGEMHDTQEITRAVQTILKRDQEG
jgi:hypothetical protein